VVVLEREKMTHSIKFNVPLYLYPLPIQFEKTKTNVLLFPLFLELAELSLNELNELLVEQEAQIKDYSEVLIAELALRDELEFEKELKNSFISHLLAVQTKRRQHNLDRKKNQKVGEKGPHPNGTTPQSKVKKQMIYFVYGTISSFYWK
jgi:hypothetical protein